jgi:hypothetical protein
MVDYKLKIEDEYILNRLLNINLTYSKITQNFTDIYLNNLNIPYGSALFKINNNKINKIKENTSGMSFSRLFNFIKFVDKYINLKNINLVFLLVVHDKLNNYFNYNELNIPILLGSIDINDNSLKKFKTYLIPNLYYYSDLILYLNKDDNSIISTLDNSIKKAIFIGSNSNPNRENLYKTFKNRDNFYIDIKPPFSGEKPMSESEQTKYSILLSEDGVTTAWNGLLWKVSSNNFVLMRKTNNTEYWYSLLDNNNITKYNNNDELKFLVFCHLNIIKNKCKYIKEYNKIINQIKQQKKIARIILNKQFNIRYLEEIFRRI